MLELTRFFIIKYMVLLSEEEKKMQPEIGSLVLANGRLCASPETPPQLTETSLTLATE